jgi:transcription termination factor NusB
MSSDEPRDQVLETLYQVEVGGDTSEVEGLSGRVGSLVRGVLDNKEDLDHEIETASEHWSVARMPVIDRSILRLGLYELRHSETPTAVVVSEAVRLANGTVGRLRQRRARLLGPVDQALKPLSPPVVG